MTVNMKMEYLRFFYIERNKMDLLKNILNDTNEIMGRKTRLFRDVAKKYKKEISDLDISEIYSLCESLLNKRTRAATIIAYEIVFYSRKKFDKNTFTVFEKWLYEYIEDWWDCDDFMTHAFQYLLMEYPGNLSRINKWITHEKFAVRRSAAVILIVPARKGLLEEKIVFNICNLLIDDPHYLVQKGYGWLLKESCKKYHDAVVKFLENNVSRISRTAFRYALEKLPKDEKERLMLL